MAASAKLLTVSDVKSKLSAPKAWWDVIERFFGGDSRYEIQLWAVDGVGMFWEFRCAVRQRGRYQKPVLQSDGWLQFVNYKGLVAGDIWSLWRQLRTNSEVRRSCSELSRI